LEYGLAPTDIPLMNVGLRTNIVLSTIRAAVSVASINKAVLAV
jgi:hypothetical protein